MHVVYMCVCIYDHVYTQMYTSLNNYVCMCVIGFALSAWLLLSNVLSWVALTLVKVLIRWPQHYTVTLDQIVYIAFD